MSDRHPAVIEPPADTSPDDSVPVRITSVSRRDFLRGLGAGLGTLVLAVHLGPGAGAASEAADAETSEPFAPNLWLTVHADGRVDIVCSRSEMGQGIRTGLPTVVADEMRADWSRVRVVQADGDRRYGDQNTDGSRSVRRLFDPLRRAGATARTLLVAAAAATWGVDAGTCEARDHAVHHPESGRSLGFGELVERAAALPVPEEVELLDRSEWSLIGGDTPIVDLVDLTTGQGAFGADVRLGGMLYAVVARCPVTGGTVRSLDAAAAKETSGVVAVVPIETAGGVGGGFQPLPGVAVVAESTWAALEGRRALEIQWNEGPHAGYDSAAFRRTLAEGAGAPGTVVRDDGDVDAALETATTTLEATYHVPHLAHVPMEPPCAVARVADGRCEAWAPTQNPQSAQQQVAQALGLEPEAVTVHVTLLGGGFGRKSKSDFVVEAALAARATGRPVQVLWTREDDVRHGYFHSVSTQTLRGGLDADGRAVAWLHRSCFPSIGATFDPSRRLPSDGEMGQGLIDMPWAIPNLRVEACGADAHVRIGWYRSVANIYHAFAVSSFADELAHAAGRDPKEFLLELLGEPRAVTPSPTEGHGYGNYGEPLETHPIDVGRLRRVVETAAERAGWGRELPEGHGLGIAVHRSFVAYVAVVAHVAVEPPGEGEDGPGSLRVEEIFLAADAGTVVHRERVRSQMEGSAVFGLSLALVSEITAKDGRIEQSNFHDCRVLAMDACPRTIDVTLIDSDAPPAGVGEPGVPPVAPAVTNALFAATGERVRELPLARHGWV